ncbi:MAG: CDP-diacylglycerol--glycerol-3-phosphate 3-phosphatidyltransferase [Clostridia bacterium]|nr:CDP-diacylglycerol--glycerol-3-phosphate 3-phosphatidyltransferase [Clostridia bacterium]MDE7337268.1 CDP-diacylglycerol--glycerol-3-phosphate 3-phosphatidyltransferase [Clostridia bacterium]
MEFKKEDLFTIPNILTYIRLICIPIFVWLMAEFYVLKTDAYMWASFGVFFFAELTDICDGYIARHFNQVSDIGKVLDPIADKVLQCVAVLMLCICSNIHWAFAIIIIVKEVYMGVTSKYWMRASKRQVEQKSVKIGKAGAAIYFFGILLSFFTLKNDIVKWIDIAILIVASVLAIAAAAVYTVIYTKKLKEVRASGILDTLDRYGRPLPVVEEREENKDSVANDSQTAETQQVEVNEQSQDGVEE